MEKKREAERKREAVQSNPIENIIPPVFVVNEKSGTEDNVSVVAEISNCSNSAATELDVAGMNLLYLSRGNMVSPKQS